VRGHLLALRALAAAQFARWAYLAGGSLAHLVPARSAYALAELLSFAQYHSNRSLRRAVVSNLRHVLGAGVSQNTLESAARSVFRTFGRTVVDFLRLPCLTDGDLTARLTVEGEHVLAAAQAAGRGLVVASAHLGSWEVGGAYLASRGLRVHTVARPHLSPAIDRFFAARRRAKGVTDLATGEPIGRLVEILRRGECIALLADRPTPGSERRCGTTFFGDCAALPRGHVTLALRARAPLLVGVVLHDGPGFRVLWDHVPLDDLPTTAQGVRVGVMRAARLLERYIAAYPTQWQMFEAVWRAE
jgi:KDO2-lipid IV(A) lauroyltransferase